MCRLFYKMKPCRLSLTLPTVLFILALGPFVNVVAKRGPHHPRGDLEKVNEHFVHNDEHLKADLKASHVKPSKPVEEMTQEEKNFYHFKMHDYDNNNLLDGLEILQSANVHDDTFHGHGKKASSHNHDEGEVQGDGSDDEGGAGSEELGLQHLVDIIDGFLLVSDKNNDGFLNFNEYKETLRDANDNELGAGDHPGDSDSHGNTV